MDGVANVGGRLSGRVADTTSRAVAATAERLIPHKRKLALSIMDELFRVMDDEARKALGPWLSKVAKDPELPAELRPLLQAISHPQGQWHMFAAGTATGALMAGGVGNLIANELNPVILRLIGENPNNVISPDAAAALTARGITTDFLPEADAAANGINRNRFHGLVDLAARYPSLAETLDLLNRKAISEGHARILLRRNGFREEELDELLSLRHMLLSAERLAELVNFGVLTEDAARPMAAHGGVSTEDFHRLVLGAGQPPALDAVILAWRRGILKESDVDRAITQGPIRAEWIPAVKALQHEPLPLTEAADAVNQGHLTRERAEQVAKLHGVSKEDFGVIVDNAGIPPGPQTVLDWVNRGLLTEQEALQALYESRIKNKWVPKYLESRFETVPPETIRVLMRHGALSTEEGVRRLQLRGLSPEDAAIYALSASAEKTAGQRDLTVSQIIELYVDQAVTLDDASTMLRAFGYDDQEVAWQLLIADMRRLRRYQTAVLNRIRTAYVARRMDETEASSLMDAAGISPNERDGSLGLWDLERKAVTRGLTPAQVKAAVKKGLIPEDTGLQRLVNDGYSDDDARILLAS